MSTRSPSSRPVSDVAAPRSYEQWCPVAVGLDILGDRWTLLVLRELLMGDQRFTDLKQALPGIAPNLLTERLRTLVDMGLATSVELPPPAARSVYRITEEGRAAAPVLRALARFGVRHLIGEPGPGMNAARAASALLVPWYRPVAEPFRARLVVTSATRDRPSTVDLLLADRVTSDRPEGVHGEVASVDVSLTTTVEELAAVRREQRRSADAPRGSRRHVPAFRAAFSL